MVALSILFALAVLAAAVTLLAYRSDLGHRRLWYLGGVVLIIQFGQFVLALLRPVDLVGLGATPLSITLFPVSLVLVLLGYAKKGVFELRWVVKYLIVAPNLAFCLLMLAVWAAVPTPPSWASGKTASLTFWALMVFVLDVWVMLLAFDHLPRRCPRFLRLLLPLIAALTLDAYLFSRCLTMHLPLVYPQFRELFAAQLAGKAVAAVVWAVALVVYARVVEPDLFSEPPGLPSGMAFAFRLATLRRDEALLTIHPLGLEEGVVPLPRAADIVDTALGDVVTRGWGGAGVYVLRPVPGCAGWAEKAERRARDLARGRVRGVVARGPNGEVVVVASAAEAAVLKSLTKQYEHDFHIGPNDFYQLGPEDAPRARKDDAERVKRESGPGAVRRLLNLPPDPAKESAIDALRRDFDKLLETNPDEWVAYHGDKRLGFDRHPFRLYDRFSTSDRPAHSLLVVRIEPDLRKYLG